MLAFRVPNNRANVWFLLTCILALFPCVFLVFDRSPSAAILLAWLPALASLLWTLFGAKRYIELGDEIVVQYLCRQRRVDWRQVKDVEFCRGEAEMKTGIPFVGVPVEFNTFILQLEPRGSIAIDIDPAYKLAVTAVLHARLPAEFFARSNAAVLAAALAEASQPEGRPWFNILAGLGVAGMAALFASVLWDEYRFGEASKSWPTAAATFTRSDVETHVHRERRGGETTSYRPVVEYQYTVDGKSYTGARLHFSPLDFSDRMFAQRLLHTLTEAPAAIHYHPADPSLSVVLPGLGPTRGLQFIVALVVALGGILYAAWKFFRTPKQAPTTQQHATATA